MLLPLFHNDDSLIDHQLFEKVQEELTERFGGLTAYTQAPAEGIWKPSGEVVSQDKLVVFEVMDPKVDRVWWRTYRSAPEERFKQDELVVRAHPIEIL